MSDNNQSEDEYKKFAQLITDVLYQYSINAQKQVDTKYKTQLAYNVFILTHIYNLLNKVVNNPNQDIVSDEHFESQAIVWQSCNTMIGAMQLIRQGYVLEPQFLMRSAFESLALAVSFHVDKTAFGKYENRKLSGNDCIPNLKSIINNAGAMYGTLSKVTHPSKRTTGAYYNPSASTIIVGGGYTEKLSHRTLLNLSLSSFILLTIWEASEYIFYDYNSTQHFWKKTGDLYSTKVQDDLKVMLETIKKDFNTALRAVDES